MLSYGVTQPGWTNKDKNIFILKFNFCFLVNKLFLGPSIYNQSKTTYKINVLVYYVHNLTVHTQVTENLFKSIYDLSF